MRASGTLVCAKVAGKDSLTRGWDIHGKAAGLSGILSLCLLPQLSCTKPELPIQRGRTKGWRCTVPLHL